MPATLSHILMEGVSYKEKSTPRYDLWKRRPVKPCKIAVKADNHVIQKAPIPVAQKDTHYVLSVVGVRKAINQTE